MITTGTVVYRISDNYLTHLNHAALQELYPPSGAICIVVAGPKEKDLASHGRVKYKGQISLKKAIDVMYNGRVYKGCEFAAFNEVKSDRRDL